MTEPKLLLIVLDGVPWRNWKSLFGNLEGWVVSRHARKWRMRSVLPSTSASCYASLHTGLSPAEHGCTGNNNVFKLSQPDIFSQTRLMGGRTAAVAHSFWSEFFERAPFDGVRDIEYDEPENKRINHGRFHSMTGYNPSNQMTPCDLDLFATLTRLCERHEVQYGLLHTCTLDSMGHRFGHDCDEMDKACFIMDEMLAPFIKRWRDLGYEIMVTADHGQTDRGYHGGNEKRQRDFALYYFGDAKATQDFEPGQMVLDQLQLAPTVLSCLGAPIPETMKAPPFLVP